MVASNCPLSVTRGDKPDSAKGIAWTHNVRHRGFTIVELLIIVVIIAILAAVTAVAYNGIQSRARDARRAQDLASIQKALLVYDSINGGVPRTYDPAGYLGGVTYSGWDSSTSANWLAFLRNGSSRMPVDPTNTLVINDPPASGNRAYFYYCYLAGVGPLPATDNVSIGYHKDDDTRVTINFAVTKCIAT